MFMSEVHKNLVSKIWEMVEKIETDVDDRLLLVLKFKKRLILAKSEFFFLLSKPKVVYLRSFYLI